MARLFPLLQALRPPPPSPCPSRRPPRRPRCWGAALAFWLLPLVGCSRPAPTVTMPVSNWPGYEYFYLAEQRGLAARHGLTLRSSEFPDPQGIVHAYLRGELQIAQLTTVEAVDICSKVPDRCPVVVLVLDESRGGDQLLARPGIASIAALRGRRVGVTLSTLGPFVLSRALAQAGLSLNDVKMRNITLASMPSALASGNLDAAVLFAPYTEQALRHPGVRRLFDSRSIPGEILDVLVVDPAILAAEAGTISRLVQVWQEAHRLARAEPQPSRALMARREGLTVAEFERAELGLRYFDLSQQQRLLTPGGPVQRNLEAVRRVQEQLDLVQPGGPLPAVSSAPVQAALQAMAPGPVPRRDATVPVSRG